MKKKLITPFWLKDGGLCIGKYFNGRFLTFNDPKLAKFWIRKLNDAYRDGERDQLIELRKCLQKNYPHIFDL